MREYKFRGKIKDEKRAKELNLKVGDWVYGYYFHDEGLELTNEESREFDRHYIINTPYIEEFIEVIPETISQFTGLYDKNGKEIYEGDIVKIDAHNFDFGYRKEEIRQIKFMDGSFGIYKCISEKEFYFNDLATELGYGEIDYYEVISNIYDNKELLMEE